MYVLMLRSQYSIRSEQVASSINACKFKQKETPEELSHAEVMSLKDFDLDAKLLELTSEE